MVYACFSWVPALVRPVHAHKKLYLTKGIMFSILNQKGENLNIKKIYSINLKFKMDIYYLTRANLTKKEKQKNTNLKWASKFTAHRRKGYKYI